MKIIHRARNSLVCGLILLLTACSYYQQYAHKVELRTECRDLCEQRYRQCFQLCDDDKALCKAKNKARAGMHFSLYRQQQTMKGQVIAEELNSFRDPLACRKTTCECIEDKNICQQRCRGTIRKRLQSAIQLK